MTNKLHSVHMSCETTLLKKQRNKKLCQYSGKKFGHVMHRASYVGMVKCSGESFKMWDCFFANNLEAYNTLLKQP